MAYRPRLIPPDATGLRELAAELGEFCALDPAAVTVLQRRYDALRVRHRYAQRGIEGLKTLAPEEAFICYVLLSRLTPVRVVEIGTQLGRSTRTWIDMASDLALSTRVTTFDVREHPVAFETSEADAITTDVTGAFRARVLDAYRPDIVFLDAHPYALVWEVVSEVLLDPSVRALIVHDCGTGLYNPRMTIARDRPDAITSATGVWERHVLARHFGIDDPGSARLDRARTATHELRIFGTTHGLGVVRPLRQEPGS